MLRVHDFIAVCDKFPLRLFQSYFNNPKLNAKQFIAKLWFERIVTFSGDITISGEGTEKKNICSYQFNLQCHYAYVFIV